MLTAAAVFASLGLLCVVGVVAGDTFEDSERSAIAASVCFVAAGVCFIVKAVVAINS